MIKAAVFDLDHTLFDRYETIKKIMPEFVKHFEMGVDTDTAADMLIYADKHFVHRGWTGIHKYLSENGFFKVIPDYNVYCDTLLEEFRKTSVEYPFTKPMLEELERMGIKRGLLTNGKSEIQRGKIKQLNLDPWLDEIIVSGEFGKDKPDPAPYLALADKFGFKPEECIYVGDNPMTDIEGARAAGFIPVWVATLGWWSIPEIEKTEYWVNDVSEIPDLIRKMNGK